MGLSRVAIVTATACGSLTASLALALASDLWAERINELVARPYLGLLSVAFVLALTALISKWALGGDRPAPGSGTTPASPQE
jgi:hypothetical protein